MFPDSFQQSLKNCNNKRTRNSISEDSTTTTTSTHTNFVLTSRFTKRRMMMDEQQMDVDDGFQAGPSRLALDLVPNIDDTQTGFGDLSPLERFVKVLDHIDSRVESLRREALNLQSQTELLNMSMDLLKNHENLHFLEDSEREEVECYVQRINGRLSTIELRVLTMRDQAQEESLHQVNRLIDEILISSKDPTAARQKCAQYLNCCSTFDGPGQDCVDGLPTDKRFEGALLGCSLDDQKRIKQRLLSLSKYLGKKSVSD
ncbi:BAG family molecular chaperone regulator 2 [Culicoides brevitarsis]|uniref:BAG family molecular chaperone regulator 2 n=1 Tax=Culicoides brevitarsis TaxID=469753 RepID=UPI00307B30BD